MTGWYIQMAIAVIISLMVCGAVLGGFQTLYAEDCKHLGLWIARRMMRPIERQRATMAALDAQFPHAMGPRVDEWTGWRYVPLLGAWPTHSPPFNQLACYWDRE